MAMIKCPECGKEISNQANTCINCGYPLKVQNNIEIQKIAKTKKQEKNRIPKTAFMAIIFLCIIIIIVLIISIININIRNNKSNQCIISNCKNEIYKDGYCVDHYEGNISSEKSQDTISQDVTDNNTVEEDNVNSIKFSKGEKITTETTEFIFDGYSITKKVEPNTSESYYHYFEASTGNEFIDMKFTIKNLQNSDIEQDAVFDSASIIYDNEYEYYASFVTVEKNGDFNSFTSIYGISPLETMKYHLLVEVPNEVKESEKSLKIVITIGEDTFECALR